MQPFFAQPDGTGYDLCALPAHYRLVSGQPAAPARGGGPPAAGGVPQLYEEIRRNRSLREAMVREIPENLTDLYLLFHGGKADSDDATD